jgi:AcrR family transcriptional regulator
MWAAVNINLMELSGAPKRGYHHGDLRNALAEAAVQLAREGGPAAVTVRAAAKLAGVTPTAAYRHYAGHEELLSEAKHQCLALLGAALEKQLITLSSSGDRLHVALRNLTAAGRAYIDFALAEPGLFRTAFGQGGSVIDKDPAEQSIRPFGILVGLLNELVMIGYLPAEQRPLAEVAAWSAAHGLAMLLMDGPLRDVPPHVKDDAVSRTMLLMARGLAGGELSPELERVVLEATSP